MQRGMPQPGGQKRGLQGRERTAGGMGQNLKIEDERDRQAFPQVPSDKHVPSKSALFTLANLR